MLSMISHSFADRFYPLGLGFLYKVSFLYGLSLHVSNQEGRLRTHLNIAARILQIIAVSCLTHA
jgi:hypothetical protein